MNEKNGSALPWFPICPRDFLTEFQSMTNEEFGIFIRLLMHEWINGFIDFSPKFCRSFAQKNAKSFLLQKMFRENFSENSEGFYQNQWLESIRQKQINRHNLLSEAGKRGAEKRWEEEASPEATPMATPDGQAYGKQKQKQKKDLFKYNPLPPHSSVEAKNFGSDPRLSPGNFSRNISPKTEDEEKGRLFMAEENVTLSNQNFLLGQVNSLGRGTLDPQVAYKLSKHVPGPQLHEAFSATEDAKARSSDPNSKFSCENYAKYFVGTLRKICQREGISWPCNGD